MPIGMVLMLIATTATSTTNAVVVSVNTKADYDAALVSPEFPFKDVSSVSITWKDISTAELGKLVGELTSVDGLLSIEACTSITSIIIPRIALAGSIALSSVNLDGLAFDALVKVGGTFKIEDASVKSLQLDSLEECGAFRIGNTVGGLSTFSLPKLKTTSSIHFGVHVEQLQRIILPSLNIRWKRQAP